MLDFVFQNRRWIGAGLLLTFASSFGQTWFIALFAGEIKAAHGLSDGDWGGIYTLATLGSAALLLARGGWADTVAPQRLAPAILLCFALVALGMALHQPVWMLVLLVFGLRFCGQGMMSHIAMTTMGRWFVASRGRAVSMAGLGFALGEMVLPPLVVLATGLIGWRETWGVVAVLLVAIIAPAAARLLARPRIPKGAEAEAGAPTGLDGRHWTRRALLRSPVFYMLMPGMVLPGFVGTVAVFHQVHLGDSKGWALIEMAPAFMPYAAIAIVSSLIAGIAADRYGPERLLPVYLIPLAAGCATIAVGDRVVDWYLGLAMMGLAMGMANTLWGALLPRLFGTRHLGSVRALAMTVMVVATAVGPGMTGLLIDLGFVFAHQLLVMAGLCLMQGALFWPQSRRLAAGLAGCVRS
ncbi:MAG: MFS transporter [Pseudomonadota bacterium]